MILAKMTHLKKMTHFKTHELLFKLFYIWELESYFLFLQPPYLNQPFIKGKLDLHLSEICDILTCQSLHIILKILLHLLRVCGGWQSIYTQYLLCLLTMPHFSLPQEQLASLSFCLNFPYDHTHHSSLPLGVRVSSWGTQPGYSQSASSSACSINTQGECPRARGREGCRRREKGHFKYKREIFQVLSVSCFKIKELAHEGSHHQLPSANI